MSIQTDKFAEPPPERLIAAGKESTQEDVLERALRPKRLADYVGQQKIRGQLEIFIEAAKRRAESMDHVLLFGPPGLGKTTLAHIIAHEMGVNLRVGEAVIKTWELAEPQYANADYTNLVKVLESEAGVIIGKEQAS